MQWSSMLLQKEAACVWNNCELLISARRGTNRCSLLVQLAGRIDGFHLADSFGFCETHFVGWPLPQLTFCAMH